MLKIGKGTQYNSKTKTGWKREGDKWVYYEKGVKKPNAGLANKAKSSIKKHVVKPVKTALRDFSRIGQLSDTYDPAKKKYLTKNELRAKNILDKQSPANKELSSSIRGKQKKEEAKKNPENKEKLSNQVDKPSSKNKNRLKIGSLKLGAGLSERQIDSRIRNLKRRNKASDRMKIERLKALKKKKK